MIAAASPVAPSVHADIIAHGARPVSVQSPWQSMNGDPGTAQTTPQQIYTQISDGGADLIPMKIAGRGTSVEVCLRYDPSGGKTTTSGPVIWLVGIDANGVPQRLYDSTGVKEWTLTPDSSNDAAGSATAYYTAPIEVDAKGNDQVFALVKTAAVGTAFSKANAGAIMGHVL